MGNCERTKQQSTQAAVGEAASGGNQLRSLLALLLLSAGAHAQGVYYVQCGPGGCCPGGACQPRYYYQQPQYSQPQQQRPSPDGVQTPQVGSPNTPQFQPLPPPPPVTTPAIPPKPAAPVESCTCAPKWTAINAQISAIQSDMEGAKTAVANLTTIVNEIKDRPAVEVPTMDQIEAEMKKRLTHSATITLLDGTTKTQTKPLNEPLEFNQHRVGVK